MTSKGRGWGAVKGRRASSSAGARCPGPDELKPTSLPANCANCSAHPPHPGAHADAHNDLRMLSRTGKFLAAGSEKGMEKPWEGSTSRRPTRPQAEPRRSRSQERPGSRGSGPRGALLTRPGGGRGPSRGPGLSATCCLLRSPAGTARHRRASFSPVATIPKEIAATPRSRGAGGGRAARRVRGLWPHGPGAPGMPAPALAGEARAASSPPPLPAVPSPRPRRAVLGAREWGRQAGRRRIPGQSCSPSPQLPGGAEATPDPCLLFWVKQWGSGSGSVRAGFYEDDGEKQPRRWAE